MSAASGRIVSPCVRICCLDEHNVCLGCFRTLEEITRWGGSDDGERRAILAATRKRRAQRLHHVHQPG